MNAQVVFSENFETGALPSGWQNKTKSTDGGWKFGTAASLSSGAGLSFYIPTSNTSKMIATNDDACQTCNKTEDLIITSPIDLTTYTKLALQLDIFFGKGSYNGKQESFKVQASIDGGTNWTTLYEANGAGDWQRATFDISQLSGNSSVLIGFLYSDAGDWLYGAAMDNLIIKVPNPRDAEVLNIDSKNYGLPGQSRKITGVLANNGSDTLKSVTLEWNDGITPHQETFPNINILPYSSGTFALTDEFTLVSGDAIINVKASNPNGLDDLVPGNDANNKTFTGYVLNTKKGVLAEEATGTWCQWCPRGAVFMDLMKQTYGDQFVGVAIHNNANITGPSADPMVVPLYDAGIGAFPGFSGYPNILINKTEFADATIADFFLEEPFLKSASTAPTAEISATAKYKTGTRDLTIKAEATSNTSITGANFFMALIEDEISGETAGYNQVNVYATLGVPMGGFESLPNPVPAAQMVYNHVARALFGSFFGITGSITSPLVASVPQSYEYTGYTIPVEYNIAKMHAVIGVIGSNNQVINVLQVPIEEAVSSKEVFNNNLATVSPNPFAEVTYVNVNLSDAKEVSMTVFNSLGQIVAAKDYGKLSGSQNLPFYATTLSNGVYFIHLKVDGELVTKQVVLNRN